MAIQFTLNGEPRSVEADPEKPLLWVLREDLAMPGTKFGCGAGLCGACTVHLDGSAIRSCLTPVSAAEGMAVTTIEGVAKGAVGRAVAQAWTELDVPQCGYCQAGQIMSAVALLAQTPRPSDADIDAAMAGNLCRCSTYVRIRAAIRKAAGRKAADAGGKAGGEARS
ncbi:(2Fe-2S)-binding protein [Novosphingobium album (ex Liu et al. 2023)]|uniref:(2Fe-2S)-binding protein n=1 Tax=Novosphingobium album (ex Liu et al. 2023) TaxID=3031130 RepID=A0ABT5WUP1_9SPHN|nr:(2Fe-2S)-binding protein [Novosphingobium album (ex Liu et al. 2023)]MDE8653591.1 (2Fe-2S)-binding protein [Novosphingobium album (ex Liu et al. 2023)]